MLNDTVAKATDRIREHSRNSRAAYLARIRAAASRGLRRGDLAHGFAAFCHAVGGAKAGASVFGDFDGR
jgi:phosphogluconate dehydratase